ncbi:MAG TPA: hypothetical protein VMT46_14315, partial [Anaerolineaceae bacterium]|nr:hypothetical protein [Anaerolineaceae bacterium]
MGRQIGGVGLRTSMLADPQFTEEPLPSNPVSLNLLDAAVEVAGQFELSLALPKILHSTAQLCPGDGVGIMLFDLEKGEISHYLGRCSLAKIPLPESGSEAMQWIQEIAESLCLEGEGLQRYFPGSAINGRVMLQPVRELEKM